MIVHFVRICVDDDDDDIFEEEYNIYNDISVNGSLFYLNRLGEMPIKHRINGSWIYKPPKKCC